MLHLGQDVTNLFETNGFITSFKLHGIKDQRKRIPKADNTPNVKTHRRRYSEKVVFVDGQAYRLHERQDFTRDVVTASESLGKLASCVKTKRR